MDHEVRAPSYPDESEVFQEAPDESEEYHIKSVPVAVDGPVHTRELPSTQWSTNSIVMNVADGPIKLLSENPLRKLARIASSGSLYICDSRQKATLASVGDTPRGFRNAGGSWVPITHKNDVWIQTTADSNTVSWMEELWTN